MGQKVQPTGFRLGITEEWRSRWYADKNYAENNNGLRGEDLVIKACFVDEGPTLKRIRPRAKGSASRINKRMSHITVVVAPKEA